MILIMLHVGHKQCKMYLGHALSVCLCVYVCSRIPTVLYRPGCNLGEW